MKEDKAILIARYCVEDNSLQKVQYDSKLKIDLIIFRSILYFLLEKYQIYQEIEIETTMKQVMDQIVPKK